MARCAASRSKRPPTEADQVQLRARRQAGEA